MDVHKVGTFTGGRVIELPTPTNFASASPEPAPAVEPTGSQRRHWAATGCVAAAAAALGFAGGFVVADDNDQVRDLEARQEATDDELVAADEALDDVEGDLPGELAADEATLDRLTSCERASESASSLVVVVEELQATDPEFAATPVRSAAAARLQAAPWS